MGVFCKAAEEQAKDEYRLCAVFQVFLEKMKERSDFMIQELNQMAGRTFQNIEPRFRQRIRIAS